MSIERGVIEFFSCKMPLNASKVPKELFDPYQNVLENFEKISFEKNNTLAQPPPLFIISLAEGQNPSGPMCSLLS